MVRSGIVATCALCLWVASASHGLGVADRFGQLLGAAAGTSGLRYRALFFQRPKSRRFYRL